MHALELNWVFREAVRCGSCKTALFVDYSLSRPHAVSLHFCFLDGSGMEGAGTPTSPSASSGNGVIAQPKKIRGVGFGDIFREGSVKLRARVPSPDKEEKKDKVSVILLSAWHFLTLVWLCRSVLLSNLKEHPLSDVDFLFAVNTPVVISTFP